MNNRDDAIPPAQPIKKPMGKDPVDSETKLCGYATASLVFGLLSLFCAFLSGGLGTLLGIIALAKIKSSQGRLTGNGMAITGICLSVILGVVMTIVIGIAMLLPAVAQVRSAARLMQARNNCRQLVLASHNYDAVHGHLPHSADDHEGGGMGLSWRVHLLPFLEENELYSEFNLDEPWDSDHNRALIPRMPQTFQCLSEDLPEGMTLFLRPIGNGAFQDLNDGGEMAAVEFENVTDGPSNTIMVVEVDPIFAVTWTKPDDYRFDPNDPMNGLGGMRRGKIVIGFFDGSVQDLTDVKASQYTHAAGD